MFDFVCSLCFMLRDVVFRFRVFCFRDASNNKTGPIEIPASADKILLVANKQHLRNSPPLPPSSMLLFARAMLVHAMVFFRSWLV